MSNYVPLEKSVSSRIIPSVEF